MQLSTALYLRYAYPYCPDDPNDSHVVTESDFAPAPPHRAGLSALNRLEFELNRLTVNAQQLQRRDPHFQRSQVAINSFCRLTS